MIILLLLIKARSTWVVWAPGLPPAKSSPADDDVTYHADCHHSSTLLAVCHVKLKLELPNIMYNCMHNDSHLFLMSTLSHQLLFIYIDSRKQWQPHPQWCMCCSSKSTVCVFCDMSWRTRGLKQCQLCSKEPAVTFKPCGHQIACKRCSAHTKHCFTCRTPISNSILSVGTCCRIMSNTLCSYSASARGISE